MYELRNLDSLSLKNAFYAADNIDNEKIRTSILKEIVARMHSLSTSKPEVACIYFHYTLASIRQRGRNPTLSYIGVIWRNLEAILDEKYLENLINLCDRVEQLVGLPGNDWKGVVFEQYQPKQPQFANEGYVVANLKTPHDTKERTDMVSILFLAADPTNASRLRLGEESREIHEKLQLAKLREYFELHQRMSVRPADISQALLDIQPSIVHFSGHGTIEGALCVENQLGQIHPIDADALSALFEQFADQVNCVILNACYSEKQAKAISQHIHYVIGMNQAIGDKAAIAFAIGFYQAIGAGRAIEDAYRLGCVQIRLQGISEHLKPVLIRQ